MTRRTLWRMPLLALLCAAFVPALTAPASAQELTAYSLDYQAEYRRLLGPSEEFGMTFEALATGRLSRISVPVEHVYWINETLRPLRVEIREIAEGGGPSKERSAVLAEIQPSDVFSQPVGTPTYSYLGHYSDAVFAGDFRLEAGTRYALVLSTTAYEYVIGHDNDDTDNGVGWTRSLCGCGFDDAWRRTSLPMAVKVFVESDAPPPPPADTTAPTAAIASPADGATFELGDDAFAAFGCADEEGGSGVASCTATLDGAPIGDGDRLPTDAVGSHTLAVSAADAAGNTAGATSVFRVVWRFDGFYAPVDAMPTVNVVQAGSAVPFKFSLGGDRGPGVLDGAPAVRTVSCDTGAEADVLEETAGESPAGLSYDPASARYQYVWKTAKEWAGSCRRFDLRLADGSVHSAVFRMR